MTPASNNKKRGIVYTFYSFKGGVGRSMALANVAALIAKWGCSVLVVDWDLEAPGLERFFARLKPDIKNLRAIKPGILDLIEARKTGESLDWRDGVIEVSVNGKAASLSLLTAGRDDENYTARLQSLDFPVLFERHDLGAYIEELREAWLSAFDFVLVDSRTGVTDIGGICTVHLADILVLLFTTTDSSTDGALQILERARNAQDRLPLDRGRLLAVPVPARDESRTEYERATQWKNEFAKRFSEVYRDWLPSSLTAHDAIDLLRIPYVPYWSFGEQLPAVEEGTSDPASLGHAYEILARIIAARLDWYAALEGQTLAPPPMLSPRKLDAAWLDRHRQAALAHLSATPKTGYMEVWHFSPDSVIEKSHLDLLAASTQAQVLADGWPTGVVRDDSDFRPKPTNEGIVANLSGDGTLFAYWTLNRSGDFYTLMSLNEDHVDKFRFSIYPHVRITRATEVLLHCANLYKLLGVQPNAHIVLTARYCGLRGRALSGFQSKNHYEDEIVIPPITIRLAAIENEIVDLVKRLCEPLFVIFDFAQLSDEEYSHIVTDFIAENVR